MQNAAGNWVLPSDESFQAAAASADWANAKDFYLVITNAPGDDVLADHRDQLHPDVQAAEERAALAKTRQGLLQAGRYENGDAQAKALDYVPLPAALVQQIEAYWAQNSSSDQTLSPARAP